MPIYSLQCPECSVVSEHIMGMGDNWAQVKCTDCGLPLNRGQHRAWSCDLPTIQGDTVAGGCNYFYHDKALGMDIRGKEHRDRLMKERGLVEYSPDPEMKKHRDEARYIREQSHKGDPDAAAAIRKEHKTAERKRAMRTAEASRAKISQQDLAVARKQAGFD
ncbi:MAG TPA: hypothetical protein VMY40_10970 [Anaerolineae bacterium]|nr:hypothetical protein [Anaerolineae bacterium]